MPPRSVSNARKGEIAVIGSILTGKKPLVSITSDTRVSAIAELLYTNRIGAVLVIEAGKIVGLVSERDICAGLHTHGVAILAARAVDIMTAAVVTAPPDLGVPAAMAIMTERRFRHLPVVESGHVLGVVSIGDLVKVRLDEAEAEAEAMKAYISS
jgi:CBS domain-containing protein